MFYIATEREALIAEAIAEGKEHGRQQSLAREASIQRMKTGQLSSGQMVGRLFKKPTKSARKQGEARVMLDDMVRRAEKKIAEAERHSVGTTQGAEEKAEALAKELFHRPGSMLTSDEIARMTQESGCANVREAPKCFQNLYNIFVRTIDGTCNNFKNPLFGASETKFTRLCPPFYEDGIDSLRGDIQGKTGNLFSLSAYVPPAPSARLISKTIIFRNDSREEDDFTHLLMQWGQFLDHDLDLSPELEAECENCEFSEVCRPIHVTDDDPVFGLGTLQNGNCLRFGRSLPTCSQDTPGSYSPREQLNAITSFIDASNVYGSNEVIANAVRLFEKGLLKEGEPALPGQKPALPIDKDDIVACLNAESCFLAGDVRANEQISLTIMHTLWLREHNRIARELKEINPFWNDERLFQEARKIVGALLQKITYEDYLPKVMGRTVFNQLIGPYPGYDPRVDPGVPNSFATAAYRYGHSLVRPEFARLGSNFQPLEKGPLNLVDAFFNPDQFRLSMGTDPILRGLITENVLRADSFINFVLNSKLFERADKGLPGMDLAALNIQRGRDHGLPTLSVFANTCKRRFPWLPDLGVFQQELDTIRFLQLHGSLNDVDLWMGGIAETRLPGSFIGPTFACIFGITFDNVRNGDRFWYERPNVFTPAQLRQIKRGSFSRVICDNSDNINRVQPDAFLSNQTRVPCRQIPTVNLNAWREANCFARVRVAAIPSPLEIRLFSQRQRRRRLSTISSSTEVFGASRDPQTMCMTLICPTGSGVTVLVQSNGTSITITPNPTLPENVPGIGSNNYLAVWPNNAFKPKNGLFRAQTPCENPNTQPSNVAIDVSITMPNPDRVQQQMEGTMDDSEIRKKESELLFGRSNEDDEMPEDDENPEADENDQNLMTQLEEALQDLEL